jgi:Ca2+/Na+ antiporter
VLIVLASRRLGRMLSYSFTFDEISFDIPYTSLSYRYGAPIPAILAFGSILIYLICIYGVMPLFTPKTTQGKEQLNHLAKIHFAILFVYSGICCGSTFYYLLINGQFQNYSTFMCEPLPEWLRFLSLTFILSKLWEWIDTFIDLWRGKTPAQIGFLHCYHHATTFFLFLLVENFPSTEKSGMLFNGFVHTLMYYHYAFRLPKFMRPLITFAQIVQLVTVTGIWHLTPKECALYESYPKEHFVEFLLPYAMVPVYAIFFVKFFIESYVIKKSKPSHHHSHHHSHGESEIKKSK